jgi:hypothetical protein
MNLGIYPSRFVSSLLRSGLVRRDGRGHVVEQGLLLRCVGAGQADEAPCLDQAGLMTFTRMPRDFRSSVQLRPKLRTAAFEAL